MRNLLINTSTMHLILLVLPFACAWGLRRLGMPGSAVVGGFLAGVLLGPTIFGRVAGEHFEHMFIGGVEERQQLDSLQRSHHFDELAAIRAGYTEEAMDQLVREQRTEIAAADESLARAQRKHQRPVRTYTYVWVFATLFAAGFFVRSRPPDAPTPPSATILSALSIGLWAAGLSGATACGLAMLLWDASLAAALATAAAVAVGPWVLPVGDRVAADQAEPNGSAIMLAAGRIASLLAVAAMLIAMYQHQQWEGVALASILLALPLGWIAGISVEFDSKLARRMRWTAMHVMVPTLTACVAVKIELYEQFRWWPILVLVLLSSDGRWLGALLGAMLPGGRRSMRSMRLVMGASAAGPTQLALAALALHAAVISEPAAYGLLLGAIVIETTVNARRAMAMQLIEAERELGETDDG